MENNMDGQLITAHITSTAGNFIGTIKYGDHVGDGWLRINKACAFNVLQGGQTKLNTLGWVELNKKSLMSVREIEHDSKLYQGYTQAVSGLVTPDRAAMTAVNTKR